MGLLDERQAYQSFNRRIITFLSKVYYGIGEVIEIKKINRQKFDRSISPSESGEKWN